MWMAAAAARKYSREVVQRRAIRIITDVARYASLGYVHESFDMHPLLESNASLGYVHESFNMHPLLESTAYFCKKLKDGLQCHPNHTVIY